MRSERLTLALHSGVLVLPPEGTIAVFGPQAGEDLGALPRTRVLVVTGFRPDHDAFTAAGWTCAVQGPEGCAAALVCLPRSREAALSLIAQAEACVRPGGPVAVDGQKTDGIEPALKALRTALPPGALSDPVTKAHGRLAVFAAGAADLSGWRAWPRIIAEGFTTLPGVFSADAPDRGSAMLAAALPAHLSGRVIDLGAGWGYLGRTVLAHPGVTRLDLVEADAAALDCARINLPDPRASFHWADATRWKPAQPADHIVMNPPFHVSRTADPALGLAFLRAAAAMLRPEGVLWLVANRHLPYDPALKSLFHTVEDLGTDPAFRLVRASRPVRDGKAPQDRRPT